MRYGPHDWPSIEPLSVAVGDGRVTKGRQHRRSIVGGAIGQRAGAGREETRGAETFGRVGRQRLAAARTLSGEIGDVLHFTRRGVARVPSDDGAAGLWRAAPTLPPIRPPRTAADSPRLASTRPSTAPIPTPYATTMAMIVPTPSTLVLLSVMNSRPSMQGLDRIGC